VRLTTKALRRFAPEFRALSLVVIVLLGGLASDPALAQGQKKGDASLRLEFQHIRTGKFIFDIGESDSWTTDTQVALISGDYAISDRVTVFGSLPYVRKRFNGDQVFGDPHNPNDFYWVDFVPPDKRFWDDGNYHGDFQDFSIGASYALKQEGPLTVTPFMSYGVPVSNYPFFAKAAIGKNLWTLPVGVSLGYVPYFSDWHFDASFAYVFSERPIDVNVDYSVLHLSAGYWFKPNLSINGFLAGKYTWHGYQFLDFVDDLFTFVYPDDVGTEAWWHHDRLFASRFLNIGAGFDYFLSPDYKLSGSGYTGIWAETTNEIDFALTLSVTRYFGGEE